MYCIENMELVLLKCFGDQRGCFGKFVFGIFISFVLLWGKISSYSKFEQNNEKKIIPVPI